MPSMIDEGEQQHVRETLSEVESTLRSLHRAFDVLTAEIGALLDRQGDSAG
jgi:uncharacterized protein YoxC